MPTSPPADVLQQLKWRYAVKRFDATQRIPDAAWTALEQALHLSPSSFNLQPWRFLVVADPALRQQLRAASWHQPQVTEASHFVVFAGLRTAEVGDVDRMIEAAAAARGVAPEAMAKYRQVIVDFVQKGWASADTGGWNARQVYIALGQFMTAAAVLGVDTCPMEGLDPRAYDRVLGLEGTGYATVCACPAGYRAADDRSASHPKVRYPLADVIRTIG